MAFLKPQSPLAKGNDYFYPLTTADQVIMDGGYRLDQIVGKVEKSIVTLYQNGWSTAAPYSYSIVVKGLADDLNMKVFPHYSDDFAEKQVLKEEFAKVSFCSRQGNIVTFECWDEIPSVDIDVDIEINVIYPIEVALEEEIETRLPKLNYSIVGGTTEPSNPTENMIWVNTDVEITSHVFRNKNTEPMNPTEGMIWISAGDSSNVAFDRIVLNDIGVDEIYPINAKQYINNEWVRLTSFSYQNGKWVNWFLYLYDDGDSCKAITGGWKSLYYNTSYSNCTVTEYDNYLKISKPTTSSCIVGTANKINLQGKSKLCCYVKRDSTFTCYLALHNDKPTSSASQYRVAYTNIPTTATSLTLIELDISAISSTDTYYVAFYFDNPNVAGSINIYNVWAE